jgi:HlyD family secretion protein
MILEMVCAVGFIARLVPACFPQIPTAVGYVEGEYVRLAPLDTARITDVLVKRGDSVRVGDLVAKVETRDAEIAVADAEARLSQASAELSNLRIGRRPEEIAVIEASLSAAKAQAEDAQRVLDRRKDLSKRGFMAQAELDQAQTAVDVAQARVGELSANLGVARLPSRPDEIAAAEHRVEQAKAAIDQAQFKLGQRQILATADGRISDIIRRPGEVAGPNAPIVSMLPEGAIKLKVYVSEAMVSSVQVGSRLEVRCDGCPSGLQATVSYVAPEPEFTPPVIYSLDARQKLMFLVEARPRTDAVRFLQPGQIVDVVLVGSSP